MAANCGEAATGKPIAAFFASAPALLLFPLQLLQDRFHHPGMPRCPDTGRHGLSHTVDAIEQCALDSELNTFLVIVCRGTGYAAAALDDSSNV